MHFYGIKLLKTAYMWSIDGTKKNRNISVMESHFVLKKRLKQQFNPVPQQDITLETTDRDLGIMLGILVTRASRLIRLARRSPIPGAFMTCMEMSTNGVRTVTIQIMMVLRLMEVPGKMDIALSGLGEAAAGTTAPCTAGQRFATATTLTPASTSSVSAS